MKLGEHGELLLGRFSLKMKGLIYCSVSDQQCYIEVKHGV